jgi:metallophosphoesterase (TIGR00282 family)
MKVLFIGEPVGKPGVYCVKKLLKKVVAEYEVDFVIANGDSTTGGFGIGKNHSIYLRKLGVDIVTSGDCIYMKKDMVPHIVNAQYILRPANFPADAPGRGYRFYTKEDKKLAVINLLGLSGFERVHLSNPFIYLPEIAKKLKKETDYIIMDFHAATTAEKYVMFFCADGLVSAVIGTHTKVQSADEAITEKGTGVICDAGRTGSQISVGGLEPQIEIQKYMTGILERSKDHFQQLEMHAVLVTLGDGGKTESIVRLQIPCEYNVENNEKAV